MDTKEFKTIDEQLALLESRGLIIGDKNVAKNFLMTNNYYRISGYSLTLRSHNKFHRGVTIQNIMDIYQCDHKLRHILLKYIEAIEVKFKAIYAYKFAENFSPLKYLDDTIFLDQVEHKRIIDKATEQKDKRKPHEAYLKHFLDDLHQEIPIWAYVDLLTISDISLLFKISNTSLKQQIATEFGLKYKGDKLLEQFMHSMTILRNLCAHGSRLFNRLFEQKPSLNKHDLKLLIVNKNGIIDNAHLYGFIFIIKRLLDAESFSQMKSELVSLKKEFPFVNWKYYGFRNDWEQML